VAKDRPGARPQKSAVHVRLQTFGKDSPDYRTWFRGEQTNFNPSIEHLLAPGGIEEYLLKGWLPPEKPITRQTRITAFGSCFAEHISNWFTARNFSIVNSGEQASRAYVVSMREGMVNSFVIRQQFEWAWENKIFEEELWHGYDAESFGYDEEVRLETKRLFDQTDLFILTFGLSEVWYDEVTGNVFWRTIPKDVYDPERHRFRVSSVAENRDNILAIHRLIRTHRPDARMLVTLSPIPLIATFRDAGCLGANSVSKATLRVAIDEAMREVGREGHLYYWPSYEIVSDVFHLPYKPDRRHVRQEVLDYIMRLFETKWCSDTDLTETDMTEAWVAANAASGRLPEEVLRYIPKRRAQKLGQFIRSGPLDPDPEVDAAKKELLRRMRRLWMEERRGAGEGRTPFA